MMVSGTIGFFIMLQGVTPDDSHRFVSCERSVSDACPASWAKDECEQRALADCYRTAALENRRIFPGAAEDFFQKAEREYIALLRIVSGDARHDLLFLALNCAIDAATEASRKSETPNTNALNHLLRAAQLLSQEAQIIDGENKKLIQDLDNKIREKIIDHYTEIATHELSSALAERSQILANEHFVAAAKARAQVIRHSNAGAASEAAYHEAIRMYEGAADSYQITYGVNDHGLEYLETARSLGTEGARVHGNAAFAITLRRLQLKVLERGIEKIHLEADALYHARSYERASALYLRSGNSWLGLVRNSRQDPPYVNAEYRRWVRRSVENAVISFRAAELSLIRKNGMETADSRSVIAAASRQIDDLVERVFAEDLETSSKLNETKNELIVRKQLIPPERDLVISGLVLSGLGILTGIGAAAAGAWTLKNEPNNNADLDLEDRYRLDERFEMGKRVTAGLGVASGVLFTFGIGSFAIGLVKHRRSIKNIVGRSK